MCTFTTHKKYIAGYVILCIDKQEQSKTQHLYQGWKFPPHCIYCVSGSRLGLNFPENIKIRCLDSSCSYHSVSLWRYDTICPFSTNLKRVKNPSKSVIMQIWIKTPLSWTSDKKFPQILKHIFGRRVNVCASHSLIFLAFALLAVATECFTDPLSQSCCLMMFKFLCGEKNSCVFCFCPVNQIYTQRPTKTDSPTVTVSLY